MSERIAVFSDIHGNLPALEAVLRDAAARNVSRFVNLGDHLSGPLWPRETARFLMKQDWIQISGNHDRNLVSLDTEAMGPSDAFAYRALGIEELGWLERLPERSGMGADVMLVHGSPLHDTEYLLETVEKGEARPASMGEIRERLGGASPGLLLCGHSHMPRVVRLSPDTLIVNPGSVGLQAFDDVLPEPHVIETGSPHARYSILEMIAGKWLVESIAVPYDFNGAADRARVNGRPDWEIGLRTGFMSR